MWTMEIIEGMKVAFDIRSIFLALVPFIVFIALRTLLCTPKTGKFCPWIILFINITFVTILVAKQCDRILIADVIITVFWTSLLTLLEAMSPIGKLGNKAAECIVFIAILLFVNITITGPARYNANVIELDPETETTFYCRTTGEYVSGSVIPNDGIVFTTTSRYASSDKNTDICLEIMLIEGENDYIEKTEKIYYTEDRNTEPAVCNSRTEISYKLYIGQDGFMFDN